jgi:hypothetical protein
MYRLYCRSLKKIGTDLLFFYKLNEFLHCYRNEFHIELHVRIIRYEKLQKNYNYAHIFHYSPFPRDR